MEVSDLDVANRANHDVDASFDVDFVANGFFRGHLRCE